MSDIERQENESGAANAAAMDVVLGMEGRLARAEQLLEERTVELGDVRKRLATALQELEKAQVAAFVLADAWDAETAPPRKILRIARGYRGVAVMIAAAVRKGGT